MFGCDIVVVTVVLHQLQLSLKHHDDRLMDTDILLLTHPNHTIHNYHGNF